MIVEWLLRNIRIPKDEAIKVLEKLDEDKDGFVSLGEFISAVKRLR